MNIQSASLDVPGGCPNKCKFCVSAIWNGKDSQGKNMMRNVFSFDEDQHLVYHEFYERLLYLRQHNVDTLVFTGSASEAIYNKKYLDMFWKANDELGDNRFINIELQTSGVSLKENLHFLNDCGVKTISLSLASLHTDTNFDIMQTPNNLRTWNIHSLCMDIKKAGFNLRLSLNINKEGYGKYIADSPGPTTLAIADLFEGCEMLQADQVTLRKLYSDGSDTKVANWIFENEVDESWWKTLTAYIMNRGRVLNKLTFGATKYSVHGMSTVIDEDCMAKDEKKTDFKYLILRRNNRLYSEWDDPASLIF